MLLKKLRKISMITTNLVLLKKVCELGAGGGAEKTNEKPGRKPSYQKPWF
jgi:hypothetical protein